MGYVDYETMMEFKRKMLARFHEDEGAISKEASRSDIHTLCRLNVKKMENLSQALSSPAFEGHSKLKPSETYELCMGTKRYGFYFSEGNGNGYVAAPSDMLHQRKRYTGWQKQAGEQEAFTWRDLLNALLGEELMDDLISEDRIKIVSVDRFPGVTRASPSLQISIAMSPSDFLEAVKAANISDLCIKGSPSMFSETDGCYFSFRGRIYIAEAPFERTKTVHGETVVKAKFCKRIYAFAHIIISAVSSDGNTILTIGQLKY